MRKVRITSPSARVAAIDVWWVLLRVAASKRSSICRGPCRTCLCARWESPVYVDGLLRWCQRRYRGFKPLNHLCGLAYGRVNQSMTVNLPNDANLFGGDGFRYGCGPTEA